MNGSTDFIIRTEDLRPEEVLKLFVSTARDAEIVTALKSPMPIVIEGSRGTGKSLLMRVCEQEQLKEFNSKRVLQVYLSFAKSSLLNSADPQQFQHWMLARLCARILRSLAQQGFESKPTTAVKVLSGGSTRISSSPLKLEAVAEEFENSYKKPGRSVDADSIPLVEDFKDAVQDLCEELGIRRLNVLFDEAAHIFRPEQQRQFFTLFRDLRSPYLTCNAAVYPGVTAYGSTFETTHDAQLKLLNRDVLDPAYRDQMRDIVYRQAESSLQREIAKNGENFDALAYAVSGNPRLLLKTVALAGKLRTSEVESVIKEFYRTTIWAEHSGLAERYPGHKELIDWGRTFVEGTAIPEAIKRNSAWQSSGRAERTSTIWIHRDAPEAAKEGLRLLTYTGILSKIDSGIVATRSEIGTRFGINIGCLAASASRPIAFISDLRKGMTIKRFTEFGANFSSFVDISKKVGDKIEADSSVALSVLLARDISVLDLSEHQEKSLRSIDMQTVGKALNASEEEFQEAKYIGPVRSRKIKNIVTAAVLEYLSG